MEGEKQEGAPVDQQQAVIYLTILFVLQVLLFIFSIVSGQQNITMFCILRVMFLIGAHCLKNVTWAAYYTIFALIAALYVFDPVGLWITGKGAVHTKIQNAFGVMLFLGCIAAVVIGYFYKKALERQVEEGFFQNVPQGYSNPNEKNAYLYKKGEKANQPPPSKNFAQFSGQGYSLD